MKIAFDVKGVLLGEHQDIVREFFMWCKDQGHQVTVWDKNAQLAYETAKELGHPFCQPTHLKDEFDCCSYPEQCYQDICVSNQDACDIATHTAIYVNDLVELDDFKNFLSIMHYNGPVKKHRMD